MIFRLRIGASAVYATKGFEFGRMVRHHNRRHLGARAALAKVGGGAAAMLGPLFSEIFVGYGEVRQMTGDDAVNAHLSHLVQGRDKSDRELQNEKELAH